MRRWGIVVIVAATAAVAGALAPAASSHRDPCHLEHACPSDHHTYTWNGLYCTSYADERLPNDTRTVVWQGRTYWCHGSATTSVPASGSGGTPSSGGDGESAASPCGIERWSVKTLTDPAGRKLRLTASTPTTVARLRTLPVRRGPAGSRGRGVESTVYRVRALLVAAKVEADSDIHLVLADPQTRQTMIAELPALGCTKTATPAARKLMQRARVAFLHACGDPGSDTFADLPPGAHATLSGVGFFDFLHGQRGVAPNGIELHPVLSFSGALCR